MIDTKYIVSTKIDRRRQREGERIEIIINFFTTQAITISTVEVTSHLHSTKRIDNAIYSTSISKQC